MPVVVGMPSPVIPGPVMAADVIARSMTAWIYIERIWAGWVRVKPPARGMQAAGRCIPKLTMSPGGRPIAPVSASISETVRRHTPVTPSSTIEARGSPAQVSETARRKAMHLCVRLAACGNEKCSTKHHEEPYKFQNPLSPARLHICPLRRSRFKRSCSFLGTDVATSMYFLEILKLRSRKDLPPYARCGSERDWRPWSHLRHNLADIRQNSYC